MNQLIAVALLCALTGFQSQAGENKPPLQPNILVGLFTPIPGSSRPDSPIHDVGITCEKTCDKTSCSRICPDDRTCSTLCDVNGNAHCDCQ